MFLSNVMPPSSGPNNKASEKIVDIILASSLLGLYFDIEEGSSSLLRNAHDLVADYLDLYLRRQRLLSIVTNNLNNYLTN
jgi:hypothetical protein